MSNSVSKNTKRAVMHIKRHAPVDTRNYKVLLSTKPVNYDDLVVTFENYDGSRKVLPLRKPFFYNEDNKLLREAQILLKLNTLKHDFNAKYYLIN